MLPKVVYHVAEAANWPLIQRHGLLSAERLAKLAGLSVPERRTLLSSQRLTSVKLPGGFEIRDQKPMPPSGLERCLVGMTPSEWYALLNQRVFFWIDPARLERMTRALSHNPQVILTIDTESLLASHGKRAHVTPFNTGNARRRPARRGRATFVPYTQWLKHRWASEAEALQTPRRSLNHPPAELTVLHSVPDVMGYVISETLVTTSA